MYKQRGGWTPFLFSYWFQSAESTHQAREQTVPNTLFYGSPGSTLLPSWKTVRNGEDW